MAFSTISAHGGRLESVEIPWGVDSEQTEGVYPLNPGGDPCHSITLAKDRPLSEPILAPFRFFGTQSLNLT
jgi:hypothetical protein